MNALVYCTVKLYTEIVVYALNIRLRLAVIFSLIMLLADIICITNNPVWFPGRITTD